MTIEQRIAALDSLERLEIEMEIDKRLLRRKDCDFKRAIEFNTGSKGLAADKLIEALDKRYVRRNH